jgi:predicted anti-sigma-YlaC factor YlaD
MNCHEFRELLQRRLDGEAVVDSAELRAHLKGCGVCRALEAAARRLETGIQLLSHPQPSSVFSARIVATVLAHQRARRRRRLLLRASFALAACLLVAVLLGVWLNQRTQEVTLTPPIARETPRPEAPAVGPSLRESMTDVAQLTIRRADETVRNLLPESSPNAAVPSPLTASVASLREAGNSVSAGLEPVTDSARRALNLFLGEIPPVRREDKRGS